VPTYGVTRFGESAPFGQPGLSLLSGHDDIDGQIFRYLGLLRRGDVVDVAQGRRTYRYVVRSVNVMTPGDVGMLNAPRTRPTLALVSCTCPGWLAHPWLKARGRAVDTAPRHRASARCDQAGSVGWSWRLGASG